MWQSCSFCILASSPLIISAFIEAWNLTDIAASPGRGSWGKRENWEKAKKQPVSVIVQPDGALSLLKHEYNLLIRLWPASPTKMWIRSSFSFPPADSLWISITPYPSSASPSIHSLSSFSNMALCSLNVNHISASFIRLCALLMFSEQRQHHQAQLFIHDNSKVARDAALFSASPNIHWTVDLTSADMPHAELIFWGFKSIIMWVRNTSSCMRVNFKLP